MQDAHRNPKGLREGGQDRALSFRSMAPYYTFSNTLFVRLHEIVRSCSRGLFDFDAAASIPTN